MNPVMTYNFVSAVRGETNVPDLGTLAFDYKAGVVTPKNVDEQNLLETLVTMGLADRNTTKSAAKSTAAKTPVEPKETSEE